MAEDLIALKMKQLEAEIINAKNKINLHERILKRVLPDLYTEEESKPAPGAVLDVATQVSRVDRCDASFDGRG